METIGFETDFGLNRTGFSGEIVKKLNLDR